MRPRSRRPPARWSRQLAWSCSVIRFGWIRVACGAVRNNRQVAGLALLLALFLLNVSLTFQSAWPTPGIRWTGTLSLELAAFILLLMAATRCSGTSPRALRWCAAIWSVLVLGHYAEVTATALYGREINLYWDLRFVPDVAALLAAPQRMSVVILAALAALLVMFLLYKILRWAIGRIGAAAAEPRQRIALGTVAA